MSQRSVHLSLARWALLGLLAEQPRHGFALTKLLAPRGEVGQLWSVPISAVYRSLAGLEQAGLVRATSIEASYLGPQRTVYAITDVGGRILEAWLGEPVSHVRDVRSELMLKLLLLERSNQSHHALLDAQRERFAEVVAALEDTAPQAGVLGHWRLENARAVIRFLAAARQQMA